MYLVVTSQLSSAGPVAGILWIGFSICLTFLLVTLTRGNVNKKRRHKLYPHEHPTMGALRGSNFKRNNGRFTAV